MNFPPPFRPPWIPHFPPRYRGGGPDRADFGQRDRGWGVVGLLPPQHDGRPLAHRASAEATQDEDDVLEEQRRRGVGGHGRLASPRHFRRRNLQLRRGYRLRQGMWPWLPILPWFFSAWAGLKMPVRGLIRILLFFQIAKSENMTSTSCTPGMDTRKNNKKWKGNNELAS